jgi:hypothetical protein
MLVKRAHLTELLIGERPSISYAAREIKNRRVFKQ